MFTEFSKNILGTAPKGPHHILLLDDNTKLRSVLARYILLSCSEREHSCTLYQLSETGEPILTYAHNPLAEQDEGLSPAANQAAGGKPSLAKEPDPLASEFIIYEAAFPRQVVEWLNRLKTASSSSKSSNSSSKTPALKRLTIISDVIMPADTQVGLGGLLTSIAQWQIPVNLLFMSTEPQGYRLAQTLLGGNSTTKPYFLIKGSDNFNRLPQALVEGADRFTYQILPKRNYSSPSMSAVSIERAA